MQIRRIYHPGAAFATPQQTLRDAALRMRSRALSCLPVMDCGELVGILTERDLVEAAAKGVPPSVARVADYMTDGAVSVTVEDDASVAGMKMLAIGCRHLPVTDRGDVVGMVSTRDIFLSTGAQAA